MVNRDKSTKVLILLGPGFGPQILIPLPPDIAIPLQLANVGYLITLVESFKNIRKPSFYILRNLQVLATPAKACNKSNILHKLLCEPIHVFKRYILILKHCNEVKYDVIFVSRSLLDGLLALLLKKASCSCHIVFLSENPLEQSWVTRRFYAKHKVLADITSVFRWCLSLYLLRKVDLIIVISEWLKEDLIKKGIAESKIVVLPEGADSYRYPRVSKYVIREKLGLKKDERIIIYVGSIDRLRNLGKLIISFYKVKKEVKDIKLRLLIVGDGNDRQNLEALSRKLGISDSITFTGIVDPRIVPEYIVASDIGLSIVPPFEFYKLSSPIKLFEYMCTGIPVIANEEIFEHKKVIEESEGGILVPYSSESIANAIIYLLKNSSEAINMGKRGAEWVRRFRTFDILLQQLNNYLQSFFATKQYCKRKVRKLY